MQFIVVENKIKQNIKDFKNFKITLNDNIFTSKNKIMGFEGIASVNYWEAVSLLLPDEINFKNRNQKPENDVVNSMLNYGYAILASEIAKNIVTLGLDPYCGLLHADLKRRQSLIFDLIEEFRQQIVDKTVFKLINTNQINETNIDKRNNSLKLESRKLLTGEIMAKIHSDLTFENEKVTYAKIIENQTKKSISYTKETKQKFKLFSCFCIFFVCLIFQRIFWFISFISFSFPFLYFFVLFFLLQKNKIFNIDLQI